MVYLCLINGIADRSTVSSFCSNGSKKTLISKSRAVQKGCGSQIRRVPQPISYTARAKIKSDEQQCLCERCIAKYC